MGTRDSLKEEVKDLRRNFLLRSFLQRGIHHSKPSSKRGHSWESERQGNRPIFKTNIIPKNWITVIGTRQTSAAVSTRTRRASAKAHRVACGLAYLAPRQHPIPFFSRPCSTSPLPLAETARLAEFPARDLNSAPSRLRREPAVRAIESTPSG